MKKERQALHVSSHLQNLDFKKRNEGSFGKRKGARG
jgi:hypothetical protein